MQNEIQVQVQEMTSVQISEATGKAHTNVMRDIRKMAEQLGQLKSDSAKTTVMLDNDGYYIGTNLYEDAQGKNRPMYELNGKAVLLLASGYNVVLRAKIIDKLEELTVAENRRREVALRERHDEGRPSASVQEVEASIKWIEFQRMSLGLGKSSTLGLIQKEGKRLGLPVVSSINATQTTHTATELLEYFGIKVSTVDFNKKMLKLGLLKECTKGKGKKAKTYKILTDSGLEYGENRMLPNGKGVMWPVYFRYDFWNLCYILGLVDDDLPF